MPTIQRERPQNLLVFSKGIVEKTSKLDTVAKYAQSVFGFADCLSPLPGPVKNLDSLLGGYISINKGTKIIGHTSTWISKNSEEKSFWESNHLTKVISTAFLTVVSLFDFTSLFRTMTDAAKMGSTARVVKDSAFMGAMTFGYAGAIRDIRKAGVQKKESKKHLIKWQTLQGMSTQDLVEKYREKIGGFGATEAKQEKWINRISLISFDRESEVRTLINKKVTTWENAVKDAKTKGTSGWFDLAKCVNKFVQLVFSLVLFLLPVVCLTLKVIDVSIKLLLGHIGLSGMVWDDYKPTIGTLPNNMNGKVERWIELERNN